MQTVARFWPFAALGLSGTLLFLACGGSETKPQAAQHGSITGQIGSKDDRSRCDYQGRADREVQETAGPGSFQPNIRRVFALMGTGDDARRVLLCREVDTNLDGVKDVVRTYNDHGDALHELADANFDGKVDTWITFSRGRIAKVQVDGNNDSTPDESRFYLGGKLSRLQRDTNFDGKADVWEIYDQGRLQRMGVDLDHDGHVDRWDRDQVVQRALEESDRTSPDEEARATPAPTAFDAGVADATVTDARVSARKR
jgi:hypothetical protein